MKALMDKKLPSRSVYWMVISLAALSCGRSAPAQTNAPADTLGTNTPASSLNANNVTDLGNVTVVGHLDQARNQILPDLGASAYTINQNQIASLSQGGNAPMNEIILRAPGVAQDSAPNGDLHVRGEHANLQYRINDVLLPEGISGFGLELSPHFIQSLQLVTGSLPAQCGFRTAGVVDIQTKSGAFENGGDVEMYGGSYNTINPSFEAAGSSGKLNYFVNGSYNHDELGIENPTSSPTAIHDNTSQSKSFSYFSYLLDDTSRVNVMLSASCATFEVPNTPGLPVGKAPGGDPWNSTQGPPTFDSANLNENQVEQNYFGVVTYQKTAGLLNYQVSALGRNSEVHFTPDPVGDLYFNGVASDVQRNLYSGGLQADSSLEVGDEHTFRSGFMVLDESVSQNATTTVFPMSSTDASSFNPTGPAYNLTDNSSIYGVFAGTYLQDEWAITDQLTANYGARFDLYQSSFDAENQVSPRANLVYKPTDWTTLHAGYARYFTPPPVENVSSTTVNKYDGTSNQSPAGPNAPDSPVKAERANYFDAGIIQKINQHFQVGLDGYYKDAKNQLDDGLFGQTLILSAFNCSRGEIYGTELTTSYTDGGFSTYANFAYSVAKGEDWNSAQFLFDPNDAAYVRDHWIYLDHDQEWTGSYGTSYLWNESARTRTRVYLDALTGSGLRTDSTTATGEVIPNGGTVPAYYSINCGAEQSFKLQGTQLLKARLDIVNVTDNSYQLRNGSGVGVNAAQYGARIGFFGSLTWVF